MPDYRALLSEVALFNDLNPEQIDRVHENAQARTLQRGDVLFSEGEARYLEGRGLPVGLFQEASYNDLVMQLPPSFSLSMMSDGILDLLPGDTLKEKEAALPRLVSEAGGTLDGLRQVFGLANLRDMPDDIALLVLSRNLA